MPRKVPREVPREVHAILTNRKAFLVRPFPYDELLPYWSFAVANFHFMMKRNPSYARCKWCGMFRSDHLAQDKCKRGDEGNRYEARWDGKAKMIQRDALGVGLFYATRKKIEEELGLKFILDKAEVRDLEEREGKLWLKSEGKWEFQNDCVEAMMKASRRGGGLILNATGSGKTNIAALFASRVRGPIVFIVDQLDLLWQAKRDIEKTLNEKIGYVGESKRKIRRVTIATIQTLHQHRESPKIKKWFRKIQAVIIDEIHVQINKRNFDVVNQIRPVACYGLTATLEMKKKPVRLRAWSLAGRVIFEYPLQKGMTEGVLSKGVAVFVNFDNQVTDQVKKMKYLAAYQERIVQNVERNAMIEEIIKYGLKKGKYIILLLSRLKHLKEISARCRGIPRRIVAGHYRGDHIKSSTRKEFLQEFEKGEVRLIIANQVFKKGIDVKRVDVVIDAAAQSSRNDAIQKFGRGIRKHILKKGLYYFDIQDIDQDHRRKKDKHWFARAAYDRKKALQSVGIRSGEVDWNRNEDPKILYQKARKLLARQLNVSEQ